MERRDGREVLAMARATRASDEWDQIGWGRPSKRATAYSPAQRIMAVLAGLACGLRGVASGNTWLRTSSALRGLFGGRFPDQGTIHRWLHATSAEQAAKMRSHLHRLVRRQGRIRDVLRRGTRLFVDVDAQGLVARGERFEGAAWGKMEGGFDRGYQRFTAYAGQTQEVLDEFLRPATATLLSDLPELVSGLTEIFDESERCRVVIRADAHGGTVKNIRSIQQAGFSWLCRMQSRLGIERIRRECCGEPGTVFTVVDSHGAERRQECWTIPEWTIRQSRTVEVRTRAVVYREVVEGKEFWLVLLTDLELTAEALWRCYYERGGTIEEYYDQSERCFHLEVMRTGRRAGLDALHALMGVCWNLTQWSLEELELPPVSRPGASRGVWRRATDLDRSGVLQRASLCGLRLHRPPRSFQLEVEDTVGSAESQAWRKWLKGCIQIRLPLVA